MPIALSSIRYPQRTKIIATLGPVSSPPVMIEKLIRAGVDVFRINASHGTPEEHALQVHDVREIAHRLRLPVSLLLDLPGPKFRLGKLDSSEHLLRPGDKITLGGSGLPVNAPSILREIRASQTIYLADGGLRLKVKSMSNSEVRCVVIDGGTIRSGAGINLPDTDLSVKLPTPGDMVWLKFAKKYAIDWVGISFVRSEEDIERVRMHLGRRGAIPKLIAKVEKRQAVTRLRQIVAVSDGVMVARGDLGVETPLAEVPLVQKRIIAEANSQGKPVITATQMLESMVQQPHPTRAEVTDVANAVLDGTDAVMLSAETAIGKYPVAAVETLDRVITATERQYAFGRALTRMGRSASLRDAMAQAACRLSFDVEARAIVVSNRARANPFRLARYRPQAPVIALCVSHPEAQQLALAWGVLPLVVPKSMARSVQPARELLFEKGWAKRGDPIVFVRESSLETDKASDSMRVIPL